MLLNYSRLRILQSPGDIVDWLIRWIFWDVLRLPLLYYLVIISATVYFVTGFLLRTVPGIAPVIGRILAGEGGLREKYFALLDYFLDRFRVIFFARSGDAYPLRPPLQIYSTFLAIALGYTVVLFFIGWATGGTGSIGAVKVIVPDYSVPVRIAVAVGWGVLGYFVWRTVQAHDTIYVWFSNRIGVTLAPVVNVLLGTVGAVFVFSSQWVSRDRTFSLPPDIILYLQLSLAVAAFFAIAWNNRPLVGFSHVATACYGLTLGVPILIGVPLGVAIGTTLTGSGPLFLSTTLIPVLMVLYYYALPTTFLGTEAASLVLAAIACLPMMFVVFRITIKTTPLPKALLYSIVSFLPFWIPVAFSTKQISDPVAFAIVVFWFVVPILNAIWDSISWGLTYFLLTRLRSSLAGIEARETATPNLLSRMKAAAQRLLVLIGHVLINLVISATILIITFFVVIVALQVVNVVIRPSHPEYMMDVRRILAAVKLDPYAGDGLWVVAMVFTTMVPALVHLSVVFFAVLVIATGGGWNDLIMATPDTSYSHVNAAINVAALYMALSFFFGALVLLSLSAMYFRYLSNYNLGDLLNLIGQFALRVVGS